MSLKSIQKEIKEYWIEDISSTSSIDDVETYSDIYLSILKELQNLQNFKQTLVIETSDNDVQEKTTQSEQRSINDYIFHRRVRGGIGVQTVDNEESVEPVPENVIRREELEPGDTVKIEKHYDGTNKHRFTKQPFEKVAVDDSDYPIIEYNNAIVSFDNNLNQYVIQSYASEEGIKSLPLLLIHQDDVKRLELEEGYIVDVACTPDRNTVRVRWSYKTHAPTYIKPNKPSFYKDTTEPTNEIIESNIKNKKILMVGGDSNINRYREEINKRGGELVTTNSNRESLIQNMIYSCDIVVIPIFETSHIKMNIAKAYCNKTDIPYLILEKSGRTHFINEIENIIANNSI